MIDGGIGLVELIYLGFNKGLSGRRKRFQLEEFEERGMVGANGDDDGSVIVDGPICPHGRYNVLVDKESAVAFLHGGNDLCQDRMTDAIWPVVENRMQVVCTSSYRTCH
jgi:hypothetical protein